MAMSYIIVQAGSPRIANELPKIDYANRLGVIGRFWERMRFLGTDAAIKD